MIPGNPGNAPVINLSGPPPPPTDLRDPRIRVTFPDVAMRIASDGPMYGVIALVGVLAMRGTTTPLESIVGAAIALLARSHPPAGLDKLGRIGPALLPFAAVGLVHVLAIVVS